jgi:serine phosphatase RsbU (regulator of sigma subunit)/transcriptional regulator with GAF, ATPase, and Fis domain
VTQPQPRLPTPALDLLSELHHLLGTDRSLADLLGRAVSILVTGYGARGAAIWTIGPEGSESVLAAATGDAPPGDLGDPAGLDLPLSTPGSGPAEGLTFTVVPGHAGDTPRAVVGVWTEGVPEGDERRVLDLFAEHAALAVLDDEAEGRTRTTLQQLTVLHAFARDLQRDTEPGAVAEALLRAVHEGLGFPRAILFLRAGQQMTAFASAGVPFEDVAHLAVPLDEPGLIHDVVASREAIVVVDPKSDRRMRPGYAAVPENPNSLVVVPMVTGDEVIGALAVDDAGLQHTVTPQLIEALGIFVEQAVLSLQNSEIMTERTRVAATLEALVGATDAGFILVSTPPDSRLLFANERIEEILGIPLREQIGRPADELVTTLGKVQFRDPEGMERRYQQGQTDPGAVTRDRFELADGRIVERFSTPARDRGDEILGRVSIYRDVTDRERLIEELSGLAEVSAVFAGGGELTDLLARAQDVIARVMRVQGVAVRRYDFEKHLSRLMRPAHGMSEELQGYTEVQRFAEDDPVTRDLLAGRPFTSDRPDDEEARMLQALLDGLGLGTAAVVPLQFGGHVEGTLSVFGPLDGRRFTDRDVRLLGVLASQLSPFLRNAQLVQGQLEVAQALRDVDRAAREIVSGRTVGQIAKRAARAVHEELGLNLGRLWVADASGEMVVAASAGDTPGLAQRTFSAPVQWIVEHGERLVTDNLEEAGIDPRWAIGEGLVSFAGFPLVLGDDFVGVLTGYSRQPIRSEILDLMASIATYAAAAIGKTRAYDRERLIADSLQRGLLPRALENLPGVTVAARYFSATSGAEVGGDLYDAFTMDGRVAVFVADVSGKGIAAASTAGLVRHSLRALTTRETEGPRILQYLNRTVTEQGEGQFVTAVLGLYDPDTRRLSLTAAGHPPPILRRGRDGSVAEAAARGPALGIFEDTTFTAEVIDLEAGDMLLMYTDGILECRSETDMFGSERLLKSSAPERDSPQAMVDAIVEEAEEFCGGAFGDDVALIAVRVDAS